MVELGEKLSFCIGNGYYTKEVIDGKCSIVSICKQNGKPVYGIQFTRYAIKSAYGFGNTDIPDEVFCELERLLLAKPTLPNDFIAFEHSFMTGYNLYILFKNESIYIYKDLPHYIYDEFMMADSKGSYFAKYIRNNFITSKIN